jgi:hypothetical protein
MMGVKARKRCTAWQDVFVKGKSRGKLRKFEAASRNVEQGTRVPERIVSSGDPHQPFSRDRPMQHGPSRR